MTEHSPMPGPNPMLARVRREDLPPRLAEMWDAAMRDRDEAVLIEVAGNAPESIEWYYDRFYGEMFHQGRVEARLKQLMRLKLSTLHGCAFCNRGNEKAALAAGVTAAQIAALGDVAAPVFDARERAVLKLCEEMTLSNMAGHLSRALHAEFRAAGFEDGETFELGMVAAVLTGMAKFLFTFDLVSREAVCPIAPPPAAG
ncbi:MAG TPA: carboxymuconolactone decarboxylase family protein [Paracoccaceae bacterium]|nr:carboxymuconolactone decarboxylase family protein [Paracoccaceae bacterium]